MDKEEVRNKFLKMERELDLFNKKISNIYFWNYIRITLYYLIFLKMNKSTRFNIKPKRNASFIKIIIILIKNSIIRNPLWRIRKTDILVFGHGRMKLLEDGKYYDIYFDHLLEKLEYSYTFIQQQPLGIDLKPCKNEKAKYIDFFLPILYFCKKLSFIKKFSKEEIELVNGIIDRINILFNVKINLFHRIRRSIAGQRAFCWIFRIILKKYKPRLVLEVCSSSNKYMLLNKACKEIGIPTIEIQYGTLHKNHFGYHYPNKLDRKLEEFPDYYFTWGEFWNNIVKFPIEKEKIIAAGFPFYEVRSKKFKKSRKRNQIIFISDKSYGKKMSKIAVDLRKLLPSSFDIVYKLHPVECYRWKEEYPCLNDIDIKVIDYNDYPLYKLFGESKYQVGVSSTALIEGLGMGLKTFLLDLPAIEVIEYLLKNNYIIKVKSAADIVANLKCKKTFNEFDSKLIFKENSIENILRNIRKIISI